MATVELKHNLRNPIDMSKWITIWTAKLNPNETDVEKQLTEITPAPEFKLPADQISGIISANALPTIPEDKLPTIHVSKIGGVDTTDGDAFTFLNQKGSWQKISAKPPISISNTGEISHADSGVFAGTNITVGTYGLSEDYNSDKNGTEGTYTPFDKKDIYIPYITVNSQGHITHIEHHSIVMKQNDINMAGYVVGTKDNDSYKNKVWGTTSATAKPAWRGIKTSASYLYSATPTSAVVALGGPNSTNPIYVTGTMLCIQAKQVVTGDKNSAVKLTTNSQNTITVG